MEFRESSKRIASYVNEAPHTHPGLPYANKSRSTRNQGSRYTDAKVIRIRTTELFTVAPIRMILNVPNYIEAHFSLRLTVFLGCDAGYLGHDFG